MYNIWELVAVHRLKYLRTPTNILYIQQIHIIVTILHDSAVHGPNNPRPQTTLKCTSIVHKKDMYEKFRQHTNMRDIGITQLSW